MLNVHLIHIKKSKSFKIMLNSFNLMTTSYNVQYLDPSKISKLRLIFPYITVFSRCG